MTIDETIVYLRETFRCECQEQEQIHAQIALWLEELLELRANKNRVVGSFLDQAKTNWEQRQPEKLVWINALGGLRYNASALGRSLFQVEKLPDGALPIFDKEPTETETETKE